MTLRVDSGVWETKEHMNGKFWVVEHDSKREAEAYYDMRLMNIALVQNGAAQFD